MKIKGEWLVFTPEKTVDDNKGWYLGEFFDEFKWF